MADSEIITSGANPAISQKFDEIEAAKATLKQTQDEIGATADRLAALRQYEGTLAQQITQLQAEHRALMTSDTRQIALDLKTAVHSDEEKMRELQNQLHSLEASRVLKLSELQAVQKTGHNIETANAAGAPQRTNVDVARYDLSVPEIQTGLSHDPLAQTAGTNGVEGVLGAHLSGKPKEPLAPSIDMIGLHPTASPYVRPEDYRVDGPRPDPPIQSAKFADWRTPSRNATRVAQPPGGYSTMNTIFG